MAVPVVLLTGISKGGFAGGLGMLAVPFLIPGAIIGIVIGGLTFRVMNADMIRVIVGVMSLYCEGLQTEKTGL